MLTNVLTFLLHATEMPSVQILQEAIHAVLAIQDTLELATRSTAEWDALVRVFL